MSTGTPASLQRWAMQSLLRHPALAISALEDLPVLLFPSLFMEVYTGGHREVLKAMVQAWPFLCLHLGDLAESPDPHTFKAVLDGLDLLLAHKRCPSRWKLQVLSLQKEDLNIWTRSNDTMALISYLHIPTEKATANQCSGTTEEQPLVFSMDLTIQHGVHFSLQSSLLQWAHERNAQVQLCSRKLKLLSDSFPEIQKALQVLRLDSVRELEIGELWSPDTMAQCAPYLTQMRNLHTVRISNKIEHRYIYESSPESVDWKSKANSWRLPYVKQLHLDAIIFLPGNLEAILMSLAPLSTLSLNICSVAENDLWFLCQGLNTRQLKHLLFRRTSLGVLSPQPLRRLLELLSPSLETLALDLCDLTDSELSVILPALSQCTQLQIFSFYGNHIFMAALQELLSHMARMGFLREGFYPAPLESYEDPVEGHPGDRDPERFTGVLDELALALGELRPTHKVHIGSKYFPEMRKYRFHHLEPDGSWLATDETLIGLSDLPV